MSRESVAARRAECEAHALRAFAFLVADHGYRFIGAIPLVTEGIEAWAWSNAAAGVQVEISSATGEWFLGVVRRLAAGAPVPYADATGWVSFDEIALHRSRDLGPNHNIDGWEAAVTGAAELLRRHPGLVDGREWISRRDANRAWNRWMSANHGPANWFPDDGLPDSPLQGFRKPFEFLTRLGYAVTIDTDSLSPHEYLVPKELRYEKGGQSVSIAQGDVRDGTWRVELDGRPVGQPPDFVAMTEEIAARAALVAGVIGAR